MTLDPSSTPEVPHDQAAHYRAVRARLMDGAGRVADVAGDAETQPVDTRKPWRTPRLERVVELVELPPFPFADQSIPSEFSPEEMAQRWSATPHRQMKAIISAVCDFYGVRRADLLSMRRTAEVVLPRQIAMFLAKTLTPQSLPQVGRRMGRDHTTVIYSCKQVRARIEASSNFAADVATIRSLATARNPTLKKIPEFGVLT